MRLIRLVQPLWLELMETQARETIEVTTDELNFREVTGLCSERARACITDVDHVRTRAVDSQETRLKRVDQVALEQAPSALVYGWCTAEHISMSRDAKGKHAPKKVERLWAVVSNDGLAAGGEGKLLVVSTCHR